MKKAPVFLSTCLLLSCLLLGALGLAGTSALGAQDSVIGSINVVVPTATPTPKLRDLAIVSEALKPGIGRRLLLRKTPAPTMPPLTHQMPTKAPSRLEPIPLKPDKPRSTRHPDKLEVTNTDHLEMFDFGLIETAEDQIPVYGGPGKGYKVVAQLKDRSILWGFGYWDSEKEWVFINNSIELSNHGVFRGFVEAKYVTIPHNPWQEQLEKLEWSEMGYVEAPAGQVPIYDGPGTEYNIIAHVDHEFTLWTSAYWSENPGWIAIKDKTFVGLGYGNGLAWMEAKYYKQGGQ